MLKQCAWFSSIRLGLIAAAGLSVSQSYAQTAEETVAYLTKGAEDGRNDDGIRVSQTADTPASYEIKTDQGTWLNATVIVTRVNDCTYEITSRFEDGRIVPGQVDFSLATNLSPSESIKGSPSWRINFAGCAWRTGDNECMNVLGNPYGGDFGRAVVALAYFKTEFCTGKAF